MTYLQSKPILPPPSQQQQNRLIVQQQQQSHQVQLIDTNKMVDVIRKIQKGSRAVHMSFNDMNK